MRLATQQGDVLIEKSFEGGERYVLARTFDTVLRFGIVAEFGGNLAIGTWMEGFSLDDFANDGWMQVALDHDLQVSTASLVLPILPVTSG